MSFCVFLLYSPNNRRFLCKFAEKTEDMLLFSTGVKDIHEMLNRIRGVITVKHMENTAEYTPRDYHTWKEYWEAKMEPQKFPQREERCACCLKFTKPEDFVGAHIEEVDDPEKQYIYPLCNSCNDRYGKGKDESPEFEVKLSRCAVFSKS